MAPADYFEQAFPEIPQSYLTDTGTVVLFWPNGNVRLEAIFEGGTPRTLVSFAEDGTVLYEMIREDALRENAQAPAPTSIQDLVSLVTQEGPTEFYVTEHHTALLAVHDHYATIPNAVYVADAINGLFAPDGPPIAEAMNRRHVRLLIPEHQQGNPLPLLAQILVTAINADALTRHNELDTLPDDIGLFSSIEN